MNNSRTVKIFFDSEFYDAPCGCGHYEKAFGHGYTETVINAKLEEPKPFYIEDLEEDLPAPQMVKQLSAE